MHAKKYFSLEEAHHALPKVKRLLNRLHTLKAQINFLADQKEAPVELTEPFSEDEIYQFAFVQEIKLNRELHKTTYEFFKILDQLNEIRQKKYRKNWNSKRLTLLDAKLAIMVKDTYQKLNNRIKNCKIYN